MPKAKTMPCAICAQPMWKSSTSKPEGEAAHNACRTAIPKAERLKDCIDCGKSFPQRGRRCNPCRYAHVKETSKTRCRQCDKPAAAARGMCHTHYSYWHREQFGRVYPDGQAKAPHRECAICNEPVTRAFSSSPVAMHKECRATNPGRAKRLINGTVSIKRRMAEARAAKALCGTSGGARVFIVGACSWCGEHMVSLGKHCSASCKKSASYARFASGNSFKPTMKQRTEVYHRDNWTCQLCYHPVNKDEEYPSPWYPTLDHIIPQSSMLIPDHSSSNLRLSHSWCNSARGDGSNMTQQEFDRRIQLMLQPLAA